MLAHAGVPKYANSIFILGLQLGKGYLSLALLAPALCAANVLGRPQLFQCAHKIALKRVRPHAHCTMGLRFGSFVCAVTYVCYIWIMYSTRGFPL